MKKITIIMSVIAILFLVGYIIGQRNVISKSQKTIKKDLSDDISIYYCAYNDTKNMSYVKFYSDKNGNDEALIDFKNNKIYYESVYNSIRNTDYSKIIEYGDYTLTQWQLLSNSKNEWETIYNESDERK